MYISLENLYVEINRSCQGKQEQTQVKKRHGFLTSLRKRPTFHDDTRLFPCEMTFVELAQILVVVLIGCAAREIFFTE